MFESQRYYKIENDKIISLTLKEEVAFVSSKIQDKDLRDLYTESKLKDLMEDFK